MVSFPQENLIAVSQNRGEINAYHCGLLVLFIAHLPLLSPTVSFVGISDAVKQGLFSTGLLGLRSVAGVGILVCLLMHKWDFNGCLGSSHIEFAAGCWRFNTWGKLHSNMLTPRYTLE